LQLIILKFIFTMGRPFDGLRASDDSPPAFYCKRETIKRLSTGENLQLFFLKDIFATGRGAQIPFLKCTRENNKTIKCD